jgi:DNA-binding Lrp family transcriptional regulator
VATDDEVPRWTFLTNHAHVLNCVAGDPDIRLRDIAERVGITERAAQAIVADLVEDGYLTRTRVGRRNRYEVHGDQPLRHPIESDHEVGELLGVLGLLKRRRTRAAAAPVEVAAGRRRRA